MQATRTTKSPKYIIMLHNINIRMLHSTFEASFECRTFIYALVSFDKIMSQKLYRQSQVIHFSINLSEAVPYTHNSFSEQLIWNATY